LFLDRRIFSYFALDWLCGKISAHPEVRPPWETIGENGIATPWNPGDDTSIRQKNLENPESIP
jgi:hypothetical protein